MASTYLTRTPTTENINKLTLSCWVKRSSISNNSQRIFSNPSSEYLFHRFETNDQFRFTIVVDGSETTLRTNRVFRDTSAWYHIVVRWDTTQATEADRIKLWVNGVQETSFNLATYPALNSNSDMFNSGTVFEIGRYSTGNNEYFDGSMSHLHCCSGYAYDASAFGSTDSLTGIWKPKTAPSVTYGTNGFFLKFENSGAFGTDSSGNSNTFTVNGTMTQNIDTPSNVFATMNPLASESGITFSNGNLKTTCATDGAGCGSTLAVKSGKWYFEVKYSDNANYGIGWGRTTEYTSSVGYTSTSYNIDEGGNKTHNSSSSNIFTLSGSNIIGFALDCDNQTIHFSQNGNWYNNNNSSTTLDPNNPDYSSVNVDEELFPIYSHFATQSASVEFNFGNGYFGTTAVSSAGTNASGIGIFEYDVPTGYTALSTKGLNL